MLTEYFRPSTDERRRRAELARTYIYQEFPQYFTWDDKRNVRKIRMSHFTVGRMYVSPSAGDQFYLRTLLTVVRGSTSFHDLRSYQGALCPSFREACVCRGLLEDNGEWKMCLWEACDMQTGSRRREPFATILYDCVTTRPDKLWEEFCIHPCDDIGYSLSILGFDSPTQDDIFDYVLFLLNRAPRPFGCTLADFNPPVPLCLMFRRASSLVIADSTSVNIYTYLRAKFCAVLRDFVFILIAVRF